MCDDNFHSPYFWMWLNMWMRKDIFIFVVTFSRQWILNIVEMKVFAWKPINKRETFMVVTGNKEQEIRNRKFCTNPESETKEGFNNFQNLQSICFERFESLLIIYNIQYYWLPKYVFNVTVNHRPVIQCAIIYPDRCCDMIMILCSCMVVRAICVQKVNVLQQ